MTLLSESARKVEQLSHEPKDSDSSVPWDLDTTGKVVMARPVDGPAYKVAEFAREEDASFLVETYRALGMLKTMAQMIPDPHEYKNTTLPIARQEQLWFHFVRFANLVLKMPHAELTKRPMTPEVEKYWNAMVTGAEVEYSRNTPLGPHGQFHRVLHGHR